MKGFKKEDYDYGVGEFEDGFYCDDGYWDEREEDDPTYEDDWDEPSINDYNEMDRKTEIRLFEADLII